MERVRVLELASVLAGPLAGTALSERGAQVTKVECPPHGDVTRSWRSAGESTSSPTSAYYEAANGKKELVWMDLRTTEGLSWLDDALANHDVLLENFKASDLARFGLEPADLARRHPHLIHVRLIGFASDPSRLAYDVVVQAEAGFMHMNGHPDQPPTRMPVALMDILASQQMLTAVLEGLLERATGKTGIFAEVSLEECGIAALANQATNWLINGQSPKRNGSGHPNIAPYGDVLPCTEGWIVLAVGNDRQFAALCQVLGCSSLTEDAHFHTNADRVINRGNLVSLLALATNSWEKEALELALRKAGAPAGVVRSLPEVFAEGTVGAARLQQNPSGQMRAPANGYSMEFLGDVSGNSVD